MTINIDTQNNVVLVRQRWMYQWIEARGTAEWAFDVASMTSVGDQLRERHFDHLLAEMNQMIPDTRFVVGSLR